MTRPLILLCLLLAACEVPSNAARRACARRDSEAVCIRGPDLPDGSCPFRCVSTALDCREVDAGGCPDAGAGLEVDMGVEMPRLVEPARWVR